MTMTRVKLKTDVKFNFWVIKTYLLDLKPHDIFCKFDYSCSSVL